MEIATLGTMVSVRKGMQKKNIYHSDHLLIVKYALGGIVAATHLRRAKPVTITRCYLYRNTELELYSIFVLLGI